MGTLDENIKSLCIENGVTFTRMCAELGLSRNLLTELRKGRKKSINGTTAQKIADYFGVSVDRVLYGKRDEPESESAKKENPATEVTGNLDASLIAMLTELAPGEVEKVKSFIAGMLANRG